MCTECHVYILHATHITFYTHDLPYTRLPHTWPYTHIIFYTHDILHTWNSTHITLYRKDPTHMSLLTHTHVSFDTYTRLFWHIYTCLAFYTLDRIHSCGTTDIFISQKSARWQDSHAKRLWGWLLRILCSQGRRAACLAFQWFYEAWGSGGGCVR